MKKTEQIPFVWNWNENSRLNEHPAYIRKLFKSWNEVLHQYEKEWNNTGDLPYVYDERSQVGLLAIAAKETNCLPLMEFYTDRRGNVSGKGYGDLAIYWQRYKFETWVEASHIRVTWHSLNSQYDNIYERFEHARQGIKSLKNRDSGLALLFIRFYNFPKDYFEPLVFNKKVGELKNTLKDVTRRLGADFFALHLCEPELVQKSKSKDCPGVAVIGKLYK